MRVVRISTTCACVRVNVFPADGVDLAPQRAQEFFANMLDATTLIEFDAPDDTGRHGRYV